MNRSKIVALRCQASCRSKKFSQVTFIILQTATSLRSEPARRGWYIGPVVVGNVGDKSVSSCRLQASETQHLSCFQMAVTDATPICYMCVFAIGGSRQPMTGRLATQRLQYRHDDLKSLVDGAEWGINRGKEVTVAPGASPGQNMWGGQTWRARAYNGGLEAEPTWPTPLRL